MTTELTPDLQFLSYTTHFSHTIVLQRERMHSYGTNTPAAILSTGGTETRWGGTEMDSEELVSGVGRRRRRRIAKRGVGLKRGGGTVTAE